MTVRARNGTIATTTRRQRHDSQGDSETRRYTFAVTIFDIPTSNQPPENSPIGIPRLRVRSEY